MLVRKYYDRLLHYASQIIARFINNVYLEILKLNNFNHCLSQLFEICCWTWRGQLIHICPDRIHFDEIIY